MKESSENIKKLNGHRLTFVPDGHEDYKLTYFCKVNEAGDLEVHLNDYRILFIDTLGNIKIFSLDPQEDHQIIGYVDLEYIL